jgi:DNA-binding transcriptional LysR family regulator
LHQPGTGIRDAADALLRQLGVTDNIQANALPSNMILSLLRMGDHLAIVPRYVMANNIAANDLVQIVTNTPPVELAHAAIWHDRSAADKVTRRLVRHLQQSLAPLHNA